MTIVNLHVPTAKGLQLSCVLLISFVVVAMTADGGTTLNTILRAQV